MLEVRQTVVYAQWFTALRDREAKVRIDIRVRRLSLGNPGDVKPVGEGVSELRVDSGPGYRIYFVQRAKEYVVTWSCWQGATSPRKTATSGKPRHWPESCRS